jgi:DNA-directed RNA polymerase subunit RPC12/RpoP
MLCPNCKSEVAFDKHLFRGMACEQCGSTLFVSVTYTRMLVVIALLSTEASLWVGQARKLFYPALGVPFGFLASVCLGFPIAFLVLTVMVRTIPYRLPPVLVLRNPTTVTTLGLSSNHPNNSR